MLSCFSRVELRDPVDCSLPSSSVHGILQARMLEWVANMLMVIDKCQLYMWCQLSTLRHQNIIFFLPINPPRHLSKTFECSQRAGHLLPNDQLPESRGHVVNVLTSWPVPGQSRSLPGPQWKPAQGCCHLQALGISEGRGSQLCPYYLCPDSNPHPAMPYSMAARLWSQATQARVLALISHVTWVSHLSSQWLSFLLSKRKLQ